MQEKFKISALLHIRSECIRDGKSGLEHVDALLRLRGYNPDNHKPPKVKPTYHKRRGLSKSILSILARKPMSSTQIAKIIGEAQNRDYKTVILSVQPALRTMGARGLVVNEGGVWRLAQKIRRPA